MRQVRTGVVGLALLISLMLATPAAGIVTFDVTELASNSLTNERDPECDGEWVVYEERGVMIGSNWDIVMRNLATGATITVGAGDGFDQTNPAISQGRLAYEDNTAGNQDIRVFDPADGSNVLVASTADDEVRPRISGSLVVWYSDDNELWYHDLDRNHSDRVPGAINITYFDVDNGLIVWAQDSAPERLYMFDPSRDGTPRILETIDDAEDVLSVRIHGENVAFTVDTLAGTRVRRVKTNAPGIWSSNINTSDPDLFHDTQVHEVNLGSQYDIWWAQFDVDYGSLGSATLDDGDPSVYGRRLAYEQHSSILQYDIYLATSPFEVDRTEGADRFKTAVEVSRAYFSGSYFAILCTGMDFPDALSAGPYATVLNAPVLLTRAEAVPAETMAELYRLRTKRVVIIGGPDVVSTAVESQLEAVGLQVFRHYGDDRYETSAAVARAMTDWGPGGVYAIDSAYFARGDDFPDALALTPVAAGARAPILLVRTGAVPEGVADVVGDLDITSGVIAGGSDVVADGVKDALGSLMVGNGGAPHPVERWWGDDRYATAVTIAQNGVTRHLVDLDTVGVATGSNFPDALGGGAALGVYGSPILLVGQDAVPSSVNTWMTAKSEAIGRIDIFGGSDVVSDGVKNSLAEIIR